MGGLAFAIPMLFVTFGTIVVGCVSGLIAWIRIVGQWQSTGQRVVPKALGALTASILMAPIGFLVFLYIPQRFDAHLTWAIFFAIGFVLNFAALILSREQNVAHAAVRIGCIGVAVVQLLGLGLFYWGG